MNDPNRAPRISKILVGFLDAKSRRVFPNAVFEAELPDFEFGNAFLLGVDMRAPAPGDDARFVEQLLGRLLAQDEEGRFDDERY